LGGFCFDMKISKNGKTTQKILPHAVNNILFGIFGEFRMISGKFD